MSDSMEQRIDNRIEDHGAKMGETVKTIPRHEDNWAHRSQGMRCMTCMFYVLKAMNLGRCRRNAPTMGGWPAVYGNDWCGNHKLDETKI